MTIRVEREALLTVINTTSSQSSSITSRTRPSTSLSSKPCNPCIRDEDEFVIVDFYSDFIPGSNGDDDLASLCTLSTSSVSSCDSSSDASTVERRVTFASQVVTDVWTRDRTLPEDVSNLYYSALETQTVGTFSFVRISHVERRTDSTEFFFLKLVKCTFLRNFFSRLLRTFIIYQTSLFTKKYYYLYFSFVKSTV